MPLSSSHPLPFAASNFRQANVRKRNKGMSALPCIAWLHVTTVAFPVWIFRPLPASTQLMSGYRLLPACHGHTGGACEQKDRARQMYSGLGTEACLVDPCILTTPHCFRCYKLWHTKGKQHYSVWRAVQIQLLVLSFDRGTKAASEDLRRLHALSDLWCAWRRASKALTAG